MIVAIDPGTTESAWVALDPHARKVVAWAKEPNARVLDRLRGRDSDFPLTGLKDSLALEGVASYGMPVGAEVFATVLWIGRFYEAWVERGGAPPSLIYRRAVKLHLCHDSRAKDGNIRTALVDLFGGKEAAVGSKANRGPLYGLSGDGWAALAVAVTVAATQPTEAPAA